MRQLHSGIQKRITAWLLLSFILLLSGCSGVSYDYSHLDVRDNEVSGEEFTALPGSGLSGMKKAGESGKLELYINTSTAEIAVLDKRNGEVWYSNPQGRSEDPIASKNEKDVLASQLQVRYFGDMQKQYTFYSYADSVAKEQFEIQSLDNGIRVIYTMGNFATAADVLPKYISSERFEQKIIANISAEDARYIKKRYMQLKNKDSLELLEVNLKSKLIANKMVEIFEKAGYTAEDLAYDNEENGYEPTNNNQYIIVPVDYILEDDKLKAAIPVNKIQMPDSLILSSIDLLNFFGAGGVDDLGYMMVPAGSGALINFNNGKFLENEYQQPVYDTDNLLAPDIRMQTSQPVRLPVFGIKNNNSAFLAVIEAGDSLAVINSDVSGRRNGYNVVFPRFELRSYKSIQMSGTSGSEADMKVIEKNSYQGNLSVSYCFLEGEDAGYSEMAMYYQNLLVEGGALKPLEDTGKVPFFVDLIGAIEKQRFVLGYPYTGLEPMTTYEQAKEILSLFADHDDINLNLRYLGWFNNGVNHDVAKDVDLIDSVGSKKDLLSLQQYTEDMGGRLYPDTAFQLVSYNTDNYSVRNEAARYVDGVTAIISEYNRARLFMSTRYDSSVFYVNSPLALPFQIDSFIKSYDKIGLNALSLRDLGSALSSDKYKKRAVDREISKHIIIEQLEKLSEDGTELMISGGNAYALGYSNKLINIPDQGSRFYIVDETIPFYQMVVHGFADYSGSPLNTRNDYDKEAELLRMVEYGTAPHFLWTYEDSIKLSGSSFENLYSTCYREWIEDAYEFYSVSEEVVAPLRTARMIRHVIHDNGIRQVDYDNGVTIYTNPADRVQSISGMQIKANDFIVKGGGYN